MHKTHLCKQTLTHTYNVQKCEKHLGLKKKIIKESHIMCHSSFTSSKLRNENSSWNLIVVGPVDRHFPATIPKQLLSGTDLDVPLTAGTLWDCFYFRATSKNFDQTWKRYFQPWHTQWECLYISRLLVARDWLGIAFWLPLRTVHKTTICMSAAELGHLQHSSNLSQRALTEAVFGINNHHSKVHKADVFACHNLCHVE